MVREVILVEVINGFDLSTNSCKTFTDTDKAEAYFTGLLKEYDVPEEEFDDYLDDGYCDITDKNGYDICIMIKEISFEED